MTPPRDDETYLAGRGCPGSGEAEQRQWIEDVLRNVRSCLSSPEASPADPSSFVPAGRTSSEHTALIRLKDLQNDLDLQVRCVDLPEDLSGNRKKLVNHYLDTVQTYLSLSHPSFVDLFGVLLEENRITTISELPRGRTLKDRDERDEVERSDALDGLMSLTKGFREAARHGVHHLSLSPERVSFADRTRIRTSEPGLRYLLRLHESEWERERNSFPLWLPPELQETPLPGDFRTDVYLLGHVLRNVFTGGRGAWLTEDQQILDVADTCLEDDPADRFPDFTSLLNRLREMDPAAENAGSQEPDTEQPAGKPPSPDPIEPDPANEETDRTGVPNSPPPSRPASESVSPTSGNRETTTTSPPETGEMPTSDTDLPDVSELIDHARSTAENGDLEQAENFCHELEDASEKIHNFLRNRQAKTHLAKAEGLMDEANWDDALEQLRKGFDHAEGDLKQEIREKVETCRKQKIFKGTGGTSGDGSSGTAERTETSDQKEEKKSEPSTPSGSSPDSGGSPTADAPENETFQTEVIARIPEVVDWIFPNGDEKQLITLASDGSLRSINAGTGAVRHEHKGDLDRAFQIRINQATRQLVIGTKSGLLDEHFLSDLSVAGQVELENDRVLSFDVSGEGSIAAIGDEHGEISLVNLFKGLVSTVIGEAHESYVSQVCFPPSTQHFASAGGDFHVRYWDGSNREVLLDYDDHSDRITRMTFSKPGGKYLFTASRDGTTRMWHTEREERISTFEMKNGPVTDMTLGPDGDTMACIGTNGVQSIDLVRKMVIDEFTDHDEPPEFVEISPNRKLLLSATNGGEAIIRSFPRGQYRNRLDLDRSITHASFTPDGLAVLFADASGTLIRCEPRNRSRWKA